MNEVKGREVHIVVWEGSEVWRFQVAELTRRNVDTIIGTSRSEINAPRENGEDTLSSSFYGAWLDFSTKEAICSWVESMSFLLSLEELGPDDEIYIYFNPMRATGMQPDSVHFLLRSLLESGVHPEAIKCVDITSFDSQSYVSYGPRAMKNKIIAWAKKDIVLKNRVRIEWEWDEEDRIEIEEKVYNFWDIVRESDLLTFDSKSANAIGFTFLWVAWEFFQFIESHPHHEISNRLRSELQGFLWDSYTWILELFERLPFRWDLEEWQDSMMELDKKWELKPILNTQVEKINFAKISFIAPLISKLYLALTVHNQANDIQRKGEKKLFDWNTIADKYDIGLSDMTDELIQKLRSQEYGVDENFYMWAYTEGGSHYFNLNASHLDTISGHFGVIPAVLAEDNLRKMWFLKEWEAINTARPTSMTLCWYNIRIERKWDVVNVYNAENDKHLLFTAEVWPALMIDLDAEVDDISAAIRRKGSFVVPDEDKEIDETSFPHKKNEWWVPHLSGVQTEIGWIQVSPYSSIKEHVGFRLANMILNNPNPEIIEAFKAAFQTKPNEKTGKSLSRIKRLDPKKIQWMFTEITQFNVSNDFGDLIVQGARPDIEIVDAGLAGWLTIVTQETINWKVVSCHQFKLV